MKVYVLPGGVTEYVLYAHDGQEAEKIALQMWWTGRIHGKREKMKLYLVINGEGWGASEIVEGVYTTPELAEHAAKLYGGAMVREVCTDVLPPHPAGFYPYYVSLYRDGRPKYVTPVNVRVFSDQSWEIYPHYEHLLCSFEVWAANAEDAVEKAKEIGMERIKQGGWPPGRADRDLSIIQTKKGS